MPALVLSRYRNSIGYIYGVYQVGFPKQPATIRARVSGTGFLVGDGLLATNRHVAEPWYGDTEAEGLMDQGATAMLESLVVFFPGSATPVSLTPGIVSSTGDLAVLKIENKDAVRGLAVLPLAKGTASPGELVTVIGYPMGIAGMVAKSPSGIYQAAGLPAQRHHGGQRTGGAVADSSFDHVRASGRCSGRQADLRCAHGARRQRRAGIQLQRRSDRSELRLH